VTAARKRLRLALFVTRSAVGGDGWFGYCPVDRPLTRRERWRGSRARRILTIPAAERRAPRELAD
jgi:hypothetical protein